MAPSTHEETWKPVVGFEGLYEVSDQGRVRSWKKQGRYGGLLSEPHVMEPGINNTGYPCVTLRKGALRKFSVVHRLVAEAFLGPRPEGMQIRHLNDIKTDARLANLAYGTPKENMADAIRNDRMVRGERHFACVLSDAQVQQIREMCGRIPQDTIAAMFGISQSHVSRIAIGKSRRAVNT